VIKHNKNANSIHAKLVDLLNVLGIKKETTKELEKEATVAFCEDLMEDIIEKGLDYKIVVRNYGWRRIFTVKQINIFMNKVCTTGMMNKINEIVQRFEFMPTISSDD
jgi:hypothetical protein